MLQVILRFIHIVSGATWVGMFAFSTYFLMPALSELGPDAGKFMQAIAKRGVMVVMPLLAILTVGSGIWLMARLASGGGEAVMRSPMGRTLGVGALAAIIAFVLGLAIVRPAMARLAAIGPDPAQRELAGRLRARAASMSKVIGALLFIALGAMAIARYV